MAFEKKKFVADIREGEAVDDLFLVKELGRAETKAGKPYLILTVADRSGELPGRMWEGADEAVAAGCGVGAVVLLRGQAQSYRGVSQLRVDSLQLVAPSVNDPGVDAACFLPAAAGDLDLMLGELLDLVRSVADPFCKKLLQKIFRSGDWLERFRVAPAAKNMHHAYLGGLLEHTLAVARLADRLAASYPGLDRSLLIAGALLHDIGKVEEFRYDSYPFDYTDRGRLVGHLVIGAERVAEAAAKISDFPADLAWRLQHLILSHHGRHDFGSPTLPMISEAFVLSAIDDLDAKLNFITRLEQNAQDEGYQWSDYQRTLERFLFINGRGRGGEREAAEGTRPEAGPVPDSRQQSLF